MTDIGQAGYQKAHACSSAFLTLDLKDVVKIRDEFAGFHIADNNLNEDLESIYKMLGNTYEPPLMNNTVLISPIDIEDIAKRLSDLADRVSQQAGVK